MKYSMSFREFAENDPELMEWGWKDMRKGLGSLALMTGSLLGGGGDAQAAPPIPPEHQRQVDQSAYRHQIEELKWVMKFMDPQFAATNIKTTDDYNSVIDKLTELSSIYPDRAMGRKMLETAAQLKRERDAKSAINQFKQRGEEQNAEMAKHKKEMKGYILRELQKSKEDGMATVQLANLVWYYMSPNTAGMTPEEFAKIVVDSGLGTRTLMNIEKNWKYSSNYQPEGETDFKNFINTAWKLARQSEMK